MTSKKQQDLPPPPKSPTRLQLQRSPISPPTSLKQRSPSYTTTVMDLPVYASHHNSNQQQQQYHVNNNKNNQHHHHKTNNPMPHTLAEGENATPLEVIGSTATDKLAIIMVGLPATGKTHIAKRICRFLSFFHDIPAQIFNVGDYRRELCGAQLTSEFYNPNNTKALQKRLAACDAAIGDMMDYLQQDGVRVAALDATNSSKERRRHIVKTLRESGIGCKKMFVESICDSKELLEENIRKVKLSTPDYQNMKEADAIADFHARRENYASQYEPVSEEDGPHVKIINSKQFIVHSIRGYLQLKVVHFVMNLHTLPRTFYLTRHGQSEYNLLGKIGGDSGLSEKGIEYAKRLANFAQDHIATCNQHEVGSQDGDDDDGDDEDTTTTTTTKQPLPCRLWTSTMRRTKETAQFFPFQSFCHTWDNGDVGEWVQFRPMARRNLDELYAGVCDGMTYKEIEQVFPEEFKRRQDDKLAYRYPRGESYMDVTLRLEPVAQEMERIREPVLIIAHQGILRILYAYFMGLDRKEAPYVNIPLNNVIQLTPHAYGCHEERFCLMSKSEMGSSGNNVNEDGQDEPITSMPRRKGHSSSSSTKEAPSTTTSASATVTTTNGTTTTIVNGIISSKKNATSSTITKEADDIHHHDVHPNDPIMNAPSC